MVREEESRESESLAVWAARLVSREVWVEWTAYNLPAPTDTMSFGFSISPQGACRV